MDIKAFLDTSLGPVHSHLQFTAENHSDGLTLNHGGLSCGGLDYQKNQFRSNAQGSLELQDRGDPQLLNIQNQNYSGGDGRQNVPNIILTGGCGQKDQD